MVTLNINGHDHSVDVPNDTPLLWVVREQLQMTGTKFGCGAGLCGACTVHLNGEAVRSCQTAVSQAAGKKITTIEGLIAKGEHPLQRAWIAEQVPQCGYCQSGQIMQAASLLAKNTDPTKAEVVAHMDGNLCRCMSYRADPARDHARRRRHAGSVSHDKASEDRRVAASRPAHASSSEPLPPVSCSAMRRAEDRRIAWRAAAANVEPSVWASIGTDGKVVGHGRQGRHGPAHRQHHGAARRRRA